MRERRKSGGKSTDFVPPLKVTLVPEAERNELKFHRDLEPWLKDLKASGIFKASSLFGYEKPVDAEFIEWCEHTIDAATDVLQHLFFQHGLPPHFVVELLSMDKLNQVLYAKYGRPSKILRTRKSRERHAKILEKAATTLSDLPLYRVAGRMFNPISLPETLKEITDQLRKSKVHRERRPPATFARLSANGLAYMFKELTGYPLYEYIDKLIGVAFPQEWKPKDDGGDAIRKLLKNENVETARRGTPKDHQEVKRLIKPRASEINRRRERWKERQKRIKS